jgi:hypothetical protein
MNCLPRDPGLSKGQKVVRAPQTADIPIDKTPRQRYIFDRADVGSFAQLFSEGVLFAKATIVHTNLYFHDRDDSAGSGRNA